MPTGYGYDPGGGTRVHIRPPPLPDWRIISLRMDRWTARHGDPFGAKGGQQRKGYQMYDYISFARPEPNQRHRAASSMDDFKDLVWTSPASSSTQQNSTLKATPRSGGDAFSYLANSGRGTPNYVASGQNSRSMTPTSAPTKASSTTPSGSVDAFSNLLNFGGSSGANGSMSIADRQAQADRARREQEERQRKEMQLQGSFWDRFDGGSANGGSTRPGPQLVKTNPNGGLAALGDLGATRSTPALKPPISLGRPITPTTIPKSSPSPAPPPAAAATKAPVSVWDFDLLGTAPSTSALTSASATSSPTPGDDSVLGDFDLLGSSAAVVGKQRIEATITDPGDFDWGDREDRNGADVANDSGDEGDDLLGDLGRPVKARPKADLHVCHGKHHDVDLY